MIEVKNLRKSFDKQEVLKGNILRQAKNPHDNTIFEAVEDVNIEIQELLHALEMKKLENANRCLINQRNLRRVNKK